VKFTEVLIPNSNILEYFCTEGERDATVCRPESLAPAIVVVTHGSSRARSVAVAGPAARAGVPMSPEPRPSPRTNEAGIIFQPRILRAVLTLNRDQWILFGVRMTGNRKLKEAAFPRLRLSLITAMNFAPMHLDVW
jgi:hypothetical protein